MRGYTNSVLNVNAKGGGQVFVFKSHPFYIFSIKYWDSFIWWTEHIHSKHNNSRRRFCSDFSLTKAGKLGAVVSLPDLSPLSLCPVPLLCYCPLSPTRLSSGCDWSSSRWPQTGLGAPTAPVILFGFGRVTAAWLGYGTLITPPPGGLNVGQWVTSMWRGTSVVIWENNSDHTATFCTEFCKMCYMNINKVKLGPNDATCCKVKWMLLVTGHVGKLHLSLF